LRHAPSAYKKKRGLAGLIIGNIAILGLFLILIEGLASYGLLVYDLVRLRSVSERRHTKYDPDLGWVNEPDVYIPDMYGPGVYLRTNAQGFRNNHDITATFRTERSVSSAQAIRSPSALGSITPIPGVSCFRRSNHGSKL